MACACKVTEHINKIQRQYGTKQPMVKTNMKESITLFFRKVLLMLLCLPFIPIIVICLVIRRMITNKPFSINGFINITRNVRNKQNI